MLLLVPHLALREVLVECISFAIMAVFLEVGHSVCVLLGDADLGSGLE